MIQRIGAGDPAFPSTARRRMGAEGVFDLVIAGPETWPPEGWTGIICSRRVPAELVLPSLDLARQLGEAGARCIGGFHAPLEKEVLGVLRRHAAADVTIAPAGDLKSGSRLIRPDAADRSHSERSGGRLFTVGPDDGRWPRATAKAAAERNRLVAALSETLIVLHADPAGGVCRVAQLALAWHVPVLTLDHPGNQHLLLLGARPWSPDLLRDVPPPTLTTRD